MIKNMKKKRIIKTIIIVAVIIIVTLPWTSVLLHDGTDKLNIQLFGDEYVRTDKYFEDWRSHTVYTNAEGFSYEMISDVEWLMVMDDLYLPPFIDKCYRVNYMQNVLEQNEAEVEMLASRYEEQVNYYVESKKTANDLEIVRYDCIERKGNLSDQEWIAYAAQFIVELDAIYSYRCDDDIRGCDITNNLCVNVENRTVCVFYSLSDDTRLTYDEVYQELAEAYNVTGN